MSKKGMKYDYKKAHDKNLPMSERFHYLENARHDQDTGSPATFMGGIAGVAARGLSVGANFDRAKYERLAQAGGVFGRLGQQVLDQNPVAPTAPTVDMSGDPSLAAAGITGDGDMDQANPFEGKTFQITPANMMGNAKPTFSAPVQASAEAIYGSPMQRQMSMPKSGSVTQMSPLNDNHPGDKKMLKTLTEKKLEPYTKEQLEARNKTIKNAENETTMRAFGITKDGKKVNLGTITSTEIPQKDFKQR